MLRIACPWCGPRDEIEFRYRGDASVARPDAEAGLPAATAAVYERDNRRGWHVEYWLHAGGCRQALKLVRHTLTHQIAAVGAIDAILAIPGDATSASRGTP